jgi:hypothetical protein
MVSHKKHTLSDATRLVAERALEMEKKYQQHTVRFRNGADWPSGAGRWLTN